MVVQQLPKCPNESEAACQQLYSQNHSPGRGRLTGHAVFADVNSGLWAMDPRALAHVLAPHRMMESDLGGVGGSTQTPGSERQLSQLSLR